MAAPSKSVNAWIFLNEDEPAGTNYNSPNSSYQALIQYGVYQALDMVNLSFAETIPTSATSVPVGDGSSYTIQIGAASHPGGLTNQDYADYIVRDARKANPAIKLLVTLNYSGNEITSIFGMDKSTWQAKADQFAANLVAYLDHYGLDGFDVDWESSLSDVTPTQQFILLFTAIRNAYNAASAQNGRQYFLTLSPAEVGTLDANTVNASFDFVNLQLYSGFTFRQSFIQAGINADLLAYGAKFESLYQTAQNAYAGYTADDYQVVTMWRLNSDDYQYEQAQQLILSQLVHGTGNNFDDSNIVGAAGNPPITQLVIHAGNVLDGLQATNTGAFKTTPATYQLLPHGGQGGTAQTLTFSPSDPLVEISGYTGSWYGWYCVLQLSLRTQSGKVFGPFGSMSGAYNQVAFSYQAPAGQQIVAFKGSQVTVPMAGGSSSPIIQSLDVTYA